MAEESDPDVQALRAAAEHIADGLREDSPSEKIAAFWKTSRRDVAIYLRNSRIEARMTDTNDRHPLFGNRKHWYSENERNPERTGWAERSVLSHADDAEEKFRDEWLDAIAVDSPYFERTN